MTFNITSLTIYTRTIIQFRGASSSHNININPESPPKKQKNPMAAKQAPSKAEKNTAAPQKKPPSHESISEKPPNHQSISEKTAKPPQKKPL
jgi:hypothetical protein